MLESPTFHDSDGQPFAFRSELRSAENLPIAMQYWMGHAARELLILGVFYRAAGIMLQVPGAGRYRMFYHDEFDGCGEEELDPRTMLESEGRDTVLNVLAHCLDSVGVQDLMKQVPGGAAYATDEPRLSDEWKAYLKAQVNHEHGLLNVIAECLDVLIVRPGIAEIDERAKSAWWQLWWAQM